MVDSQVNRMLQVCYVQSKNYVFAFVSEELKITHFQNPALFDMNYC
jgi:hypothetical protein